MWSSPTPTPDMANPGLDDPVPTFLGSGIGGGRGPRGGAQPFRRCTSRADGRWGGTGPVTPVITSIFCGPLGSEEEGGRTRRRSGVDGFSVGVSSMVTKKLGDVRSVDDGVAEASSGEKRVYRVGSADIIEAIDEAVLRLRTWAKRNNMRMCLKTMAKNAEETPKVQINNVSSAEKILEDMTKEDFAVAGEDYFSNLSESHKLGEDERNELKKRHKELFGTE
uniref:Uncharacterized protein n=1 Tax=Globodera pallida TaxID=36090 RepID=A0A183CJC2_GLOPA